MLTTHLKKLSHKHTDTKLIIPTMMTAETVPVKISVITPSYNQGRFIDDAIQSVLNQNYPNFEHIIIDACSSDNTVEVLKKYPHLKWTSEPDEGQSDALNKGFKLATGDVICWLNADDLYVENAFHKVARTLATSDADGVYGNVFICDVNKNITKHLKSHKAFKFFSVFYTFIPSESLFIRRVVIENNIFVDKDFHITMDKEFIAHILHKNYKLKYIREALAFFRWHDCNKSLNTKEVKRTAAREGVVILNRYWNLKLPVNNFTTKLYRCICVSLLPVKKVLKLAYS